ncbi:MAG: molybdate ABC transporter substrate-binding protein [Planctomycetota bacterium]|nr:molybdate ABC transporter substrate-binding protein [Planctomycetota bacterium]
MSLKMLALASVAAAGLLVVLLWNPWKHSGSHGGNLTFYCAAGMTKPVQDVVQEYQREYGVTVQVEFGGSGKLLNTLKTVPDRGDLFLAADETYLELARKDGLAAEDLPVALMHPVIAVAKGNPKGVRSIQDLLREDVRVVLANPELASVGKLAKTRFEQAGLWSELMRQKDRYAAKVSTVGTVNEAAQAVSLGAAEAGVIWDALIPQYSGLEGVEVPELRSAEVGITLMVLARTTQPAAALHFARFLTARDKGGFVFAKHGFKPPPDADDWAERPKLNLFSGAMLKPGIEETVKRFEKREGVDVAINYNGCGILVSQMKGMKAVETPGAFPDAYFSCDLSYMEQVRDWFEAAVTISRNDMVLVVKKGNPLGFRSLADLARPGQKLGLAHPVNSALGKLTDELLIKTGERGKVYAAGNTVVHVDAGHMLVNQLRTGALDAIVVYRSNVASNPEILEQHLDLVDLDLPEALATQPFAVAKDSNHKYLARRLLRAILAPETKARFEQIGMQWLAEQP